MININVFEAKDKILDAIECVFLENVKNKQYALNDNIYWKWVSTKEISERIGWNINKTRYWLNKFEGKYIDSKKHLNWCQWSYIPEGFKQYKFNDYLERI